MTSFVFKHPGYERTPLAPFLYILSFTLTNVLVIFRYTGYAIGALVLALQACRSWLGTIALGLFSLMLVMGWRAERAAEKILLAQTLDRNEAERRAYLKQLAREEAAEAGDDPDHQEGDAADAGAAAAPPHAKRRRPKPPAPPRLVMPFLPKHTGDKLVLFRCASVDHIRDGDAFAKEWEQCSAVVVDQLFGACVDEYDIHPLACSLARSFSSLACSFTHSPTHPPTHPSTHSRTLSPTRTFHLASIHSLTDWLTD